MKLGTTVTVIRIKKEHCGPFGVFTVQTRRDRTYSVVDLPKSLQKPPTRIGREVARVERGGTGINGLIRTGLGFGEGVWYQIRPAGWYALPGKQALKS